MNKTYQIKLDEVQNVKWEKIKNKKKYKDLNEYVSKLIETDYNSIK
jgi:hypothetical protein